MIWATTVGVVIGPNLAPPGDAIGRAFGLPPLTGAFALTVGCQLLAAALYLVVLRPDPLMTAQATAGTHAAVTPQRKPARPATARILRGNRTASVAVVALALSHTVMVAVMAMTPVHLAHAGAGIMVIGLTIGLHTAGMYALSPVFGMLSDRIGRGRVIIIGLGLLAAALVTNWFAADNQIAVAVVVLALSAHRRVRVRARGLAQAAERPAPLK